MADQENAGIGDENVNPLRPNDAPIPISKGVVKEAILAYPAIRADVDANKEDIEKLKAQTESGMRKASLAFSFCVFTMYFWTEVVFAWYRVPLVLPDFLHNVIYIMIIGPWVGYGMPKLIALLEHLASKGEEKQQ